MSRRKTWYVFLLLVILGSCKRAHVLDIRSVAFPADRSLWLGGMTDVPVVGLADSSLSVSWHAADNSWSWYAPRPVYIRFASSEEPVKTLNAYSFDSVSMIRTPYGAYSMKDIETRIRDLRGSVKYLRLHNIIQSIQPGMEASSGELQTLLAIRDEDRKLILLDSTVSVELTNKRVTGWQRRGRIRGGRLDISFFHPVYSSVMDSRHTKDLLHVGDTAFYCTAKPLFTPFGANKVSLSPTIIEETSLLLAVFDKAYRTVVPDKVIDTLSGLSHGLPVNITQKMHGVVPGSEINVGNFSNANFLPLGSVDKAGHFSTGNPLLLNQDYRWSVLDYKMLQHCLPLLLVFIFGWLVSGQMTKEDFYEYRSTDDEKMRWRPYFRVLLVVLFVLLCARMFVGYNLSYTDPYFPFAFPTAVLTAPLILLAVILCWLVFWLVKGKPGPKDFSRMPPLIFVAAFVLLQYWLGSRSFPLFFADMRSNFHLFHPKDTPVYYETLFILLVSIGSLSAAVLFPWRKQLMTLIIGAFAVFFLSQGKNSYSVGVLLFSIASIYLLAQASPKYSSLHQRASPMDRLRFITFYFLAPLPVIGFFSFFMKKDAGYFINYIGFGFIITWVTFWFYKYDLQTDIKHSRSKLMVERVFSIVLMAGVFALLIGIGSYLANRYDPLENERIGSRMTAFFNFRTIQDYGTRTSEQQAQFFAELSKYTWPGHLQDFEPIHHGVSSFTDPVVKNDVSAPFGLIYSFGQYWWGALVLLISLWAVLLYIVLKMALVPYGFQKKDKITGLTGYGMIRIYCVSMLVGSGLWLLGSYYGIFPFTGRLLFGMGQDSMGETFETIFLFAFMGLAGPSAGLPPTPEKKPA